MDRKGGLALRAADAADSAGAVDRTPGGQAETRHFWERKRVVVTGGAGFIGSWVVDELERRGVAREDIVIPRSAECDLRERPNADRAVHGADVVIHLAAPTGGIAFSRAHPASQYRDCALINVNILEAAAAAGVTKLVSVGNLLAYPAAAPSPLREEVLHDGPIADTHLGIGLAKRDLVTMGVMYSREFGLPVVNVLAANAYGPRDRFDPSHSHVIPATILKCLRDEDLVVWGDGTPTRDFLYVEDLARGIVLAAEKLEDPEPVNLGSGTEVSIAQLVKDVAEVTGFTRRISFDASKGGGDPRRLASTDRATSLLGFAPRVTFREGLERTIEWYLESTPR